jgi:hypothetical protein
MEGYGKWTNGATNFITLNRVIIDGFSNRAYEFEVYLPTL